MGRGERKVARVRRLPLKPELPFLFTNPTGPTPPFRLFSFSNSCFTNSPKFL